MSTFAQIHNRYFADEEPVQLHEGGTIKGYGKRQHGLNGKDADLDYAGQNWVDEAWWFSDRIEISGYRYSTICPPEDDEYGNPIMLPDVQAEIVCGSGYPGEWTGDEWCMRDDYNLTVPFDWQDNLGDEENIASACTAAVAAIEKDSVNFEREMTYINKALSGEV